MTTNQPVGGASPQENRLNQIEQLLAETSQTAVDNRNLINENARAINMLIRVGDRFQRNFEQIIERIDQMQSEIRGLQTENRRIFEELQQRRDGEEPNQ